MANSLSGVNIEERSTQASSLLASELCKAEGIHRLSMLSKRIHIYGGKENSNQSLSGHKIYCDTASSRHTRGWIPKCRVQRT